MLFLYSSLAFLCTNVFEFLHNAFDYNTKVNFDFDIYITYGSKVAELCHLIFS